MIPWCGDQFAIVSRLILLRNPDDFHDFVGFHAADYSRSNSNTPLKGAGMASISSSSGYKVR